MDADPAQSSITLQLLLIVILTLINAYFAASEMAIVSVNKNRIHRKVEEGNRKAMLVEKLLQEPTSFLSTIQVAITLAGFFNSAFLRRIFTLVAQAGVQCRNRYIRTPWCCSGGLGHSLWRNDLHGGGYHPVILRDIDFRRACSQADRSAECGSLFHVLRKADSHYFKNRIALHQNFILVNTVCTPSVRHEG